MKFGPTISVPPTFAVTYARLACSSACEPKTLTKTPSVVLHVKPTSGAPGKAPAAPLVAMSAGFGQPALAASASAVLIKLGLGADAGWLARAARGGADAVL